MTVQGPTEAENVASVLARAVARHLGGDVKIETLKRESGGASRQTWSFDAVADGKRHALILRRDPPLEATVDPERSTALDRATEFGVLRAAWRAGVRAPEPLFELAADDGLGEAYVMRRIGGTAIARKLLRDPPYEEARQHIASQLGEILARIHGTDPATLPPGRRPDREPARRARSDRRPAAGFRTGAELARPAQARADRQAGAGPWR